MTTQQPHHDEPTPCVTGADADPMHEPTLDEALAALTARAERMFDLASSAAAWGEVDRLQGRLAVREAQLRVLGQRFDRLERVVEQVAALHRPDKAGWCAECSTSPCRTAAVLASVDVPAPDEADEPWNDPRHIDAVLRVADDLRAAAPAVPAEGDEA